MDDEQFYVTQTKLNTYRKDFVSYTENCKWEQYFWDTK